MINGWLKKLGIIIIEFVLITGILLYVSQKIGIKNFAQVVPAIQSLVNRISNKPIEIEKQAVFPILQSPALRDFNWEYKGVKYSINEKLYKSTYQYYKTQPKAYSYMGELKPNWQDEYYGMFLNENKDDKSISDLSLELQNLGHKHGLSDDQIVDLTMAFVQAIPYDDAKAKNILAKTGSETILYPYETLYEQSGVCSDKSLLAISLLRKMGYGVAIFAYEQDNHMAIGIQCPKGLSTYGSGYCYAETTSIGNKVGIIPSFDLSSNKTIGADELSAINPDQPQQVKLQQLGQVTIYQKNVGREYTGIIETKKIIAETDNIKKTIVLLLPQLQDEKKIMAAEEKKLVDMKKILEASKSSENIEKYNQLVKEYNDFLDSYKKDVKKYNESVGLYNKAIQRYNTLIKQ